MGQKILRVTGQNLGKTVSSGQNRTTEPMNSQKLWLPVQDQANDMEREGLTSATPRWGMFAAASC